MKRWNEREFEYWPGNWNGHPLGNISKEIRSNKEAVLEAVKLDGLSLKHADEELRTDKEVVLAAVKQCGLSLSYADEKLRCDKEVVLEAVKSRGLSLSFASEELQNDKEVVLEAVRSSNILSSLPYASEELQNDKEVVLEAVKRNGDSLQYASEELRNDKDVVLEAVKKHGDSIKYASRELRNDKEIVLESVKRNGNFIPFASEDLQNDDEVVVEAVKSNPNSIIYANKELQQSDVVLGSIADNSSFSTPGTYKFISEKGQFEAEKKELIRISDQFRVTLNDQSILDVFKNDELTISSIGSGVFGVLYELRFRKGAKMGPPKIEKNLGKLFDSLKTQTIGKDGNFDFTSFVIKIYHNPFLSEEKRIKMILKDRLSIPYHKNVATIFYQKSDEIIDTKEFPEKERNLWKDRLQGVGATKFRTGVLVMKYYKQDLEDYVKKRIMGGLIPISKVEFCRMIRGIIHGVCHLHDNFIVHRDLHPKNIFVNEICGRVWVGDFGCCLDLRKRTRNFSRKSFIVRKDEDIILSAGSITGDSLRMNKGGYFSYLPPEIREFDESEDYLDYSKSDLYSVGILSLFLIYSSEGEVHSEVTKKKEELVHKISSEDWISSFTESRCYSDQRLFKFILKHLERKVSDRISFSESKRQIDEITEGLEEEERRKNEEEEEGEGEEED